MLRDVVGVVMGVVGGGEVWGRGNSMGGGGTRGATAPPNDNVRGAPLHYHWGYNVGVPICIIIGGAIAPLHYHWGGSHLPKYIHTEAAH